MTRRQQFAVRVGKVAVKLVVRAVSYSMWDVWTARLCDCLTALCG